MDASLSLAVVLIPFGVFIVTGLLGSRLPKRLSGLLGTSGMFMSFIFSLMIAFNYFTAASNSDSFHIQIPFHMLWLNFGDLLHVDLGILLDPISVMMLIVVTGVSLMVQIYSLGYMSDDPGFARFYAFLSLFSFSMLGLVVATNLFQMYMFWELVGVSSYSLIGFYYEKPSAVAAAKKAFIVTRFADLGFLLGILLLSSISGTFDFVSLCDPSSAVFHQNASITFLGFPLISLAALLIFMGGAGKSAMFPLHVWLPDAMEGPTPVSALIHAATMVVAGVYLVARLFPVYAQVAPDALSIIAWVGAFTSLFAAVIACTQTDIKRVLAYSTMSQIGYMMVALGVSGFGSEHGLGYMASMFHLFTHAMFKALLFLGAGAVIHAVHSNEMKDMGGLRKALPITHLTFLIACLAIAGIPPFAGFFSKDEILAAAWEHNPLVFAVQYVVAGLTAFYMFRLYYSIFWNREYSNDHHHPHEAPLVMSLPLMLLAVASCTVGWIPFGQFVSSDGHRFATHTEWPIAGASIAVAVVGIGVATMLYRRASDVPARIASSIGLFYRSALNKFYIDEIYLFVTKSLIFKGVAAPIAWFDRHVVDAAMNGIAWLTNQVSWRTRSLQSGQLQWYAFVFVAAALLLVAAALSAHV